MEAEFDRHLERINHRFDRLEDRVNANFDRLEARFEKRFDSLQQSMVVTLAGILTAFAALVAATIF